MQINARPWGFVERLIYETAAGLDKLQNTVTDIGLENAADVITNEILIRCSATHVESHFSIGLEITHGSQVAQRLVNNHTYRLSVEPATKIADVVILRFDVVDVLNGLFGTGKLTCQPTREVRWPDKFKKIPAIPDSKKRTEGLAEIDKVMDVVHSIITVCSYETLDIRDLSIRYGCDKWTVSPGFHWYAQHYNRHFLPYQDQVVKLLEIGVDGYEDSELVGGSLLMWQRYFRRGLVYGIDIENKSGVRGQRIQALTGDQSDPEFLKQLGRELGPFDIVIDDGSHINDHVKISFCNLFPYIRPGGLYVIEDLQTAYWPSAGGATSELRTATTSIGMLKDLVDGLHYQEIDNQHVEKSYTDRYVVGLHMYHNLAIIEKGTNVERLTR